MKYGKLAMMLSALLFALTAQAVTVDGYVYLSGQTDHTGILIIFRAVSPTAETDTTHSYNDGYYTLSLQPGVYDVEFGQAGYVAITLEDRILFTDSTLPAITLMGGIFGNQSGNFGPGTFDVIDTLWVQPGQTWTLAAGTRLLFRPGKPLIVDGVLIADGTAEDTVVFAPRIDHPDSVWGGLHFKSSSGADGLSQLRYCRAEGGRGEMMPPYTMSNPVGVISTYNNSARFEHCLIRGNSGAYYGGGAACWGSSPYFNACVFTDNAANIGSALALFGTDAIVENSVFSGNNGESIYLAGGTSPQIINCRIESQATSMSTGIFIENSRAVIDQCVIRAWNALECDGGQPTITRSTLIGYTALTAGAPTLNSSILVNTASYPDYGLILGASVIAEVRYCAVYCESEIPIENQSDGSPAIGVVAFTNTNGDSCDTYYNIFLDPQFVNYAAGNYHLTAGSPCIDAGDPDLPNDPDRTIADMGAFYYHQTANSEDGRTTVRRYELAQNYPNPFNARTQIAFDLPRAGNVTLNVFDITGRLVATPLSNTTSAGTHEISFDASDLPSGVYVYRLNADAWSAAKKMIVLR